MMFNRRTIFYKARYELLFIGLTVLLFVGISLLPVAPVATTVTVAPTLTL